MTDESLMLSVAEGDTEKLGLLFNRYHAKIYDYFLRMTRDEFLSGDLMQTVFEKALKGKHTYRIEYRFVGWIFRIAKNVLMDHYRNIKRTYEIDDQVLGEQKEDPDNTWEKAEVEIKYKEVAEIIGVSETGVKTRVRRAMMQLKDNYLKVVNHGK